MVAMDGMRVGGLQVVKGHKLTVIRKINVDIRYSMVIIVDNIVSYMKVVKIVNFKSSHYTHTHTQCNSVK